jgi:DNA-binding NarL/FixJ family response regulator
MPIRVLLADDHTMFRAGVGALLGAEGIQVVAEAADGRSAVELAQKQPVDVCVLDLTMPLLNGLDAAREITRVCPRTRVVLLTVHKDDPYVLEAFRAGVRGYVIKTQAADDLVRAIREVAGGAAYVSPKVSQALLDAYRSDRDMTGDSLTPRERQVLQLVAEGKSSKEVAKLLSVSVKTVDTHRAHVMDKLDIHELATLVRYAIRRGLIEP